MTVAPPPPNPLLIAPFVLLLAAMALGPVLTPAWWGRHYGKVTLSLGAITGSYYLFVLHAYTPAAHMAHEYVGFITLIGGLFVVAGGIHLQVGGRTGPLANTAFLLAGAILANLLGTTGAAMLLIRPWLRLNEGRVRAHHLIFFIFIVANVGGCLTPIGDPPLFLGYLQGVPFWWVAQYCWPMWAVAVGLLLAIFYGVDKWHHLRHPAPLSSTLPKQPWHMAGGSNLLFLAIMLGAVFVEHPPILREGLMISAAAGSYLTTRKTVHTANGFNFHPLAEVALLFAGIFATMLPALDWLTAQAPELLGNNPAPGLYYWGTGALSSLLDNAPAYLAFLSTLKGLTPGSDTAALLHHHAAALTAISVGSVFFGAATYLGNGPNFMVKAIADEQKTPMPSFTGMVIKYTLPVLLPVLALVWWCFFRL
jgi:Na+/H+ antiporter NhaD/arsenite permease-like protein